MATSRYLEALQSLRSKQLHDDNWRSVYGLLLTVECQMSLGTLDIDGKSALRRFGSLLLAKKPSSVDLIELASSYIEQGCFCRAFILFYESSELFRVISEGNEGYDALDDIKNLSFRGMTDAIQKIRGEAVQYLDFFAYAVISGMEEVRASSRIKIPLSQAWMYHALSRVYFTLRNFQKEAEVCETAIDFMKGKFGTECEKYQIFGCFHHNAGAAAYSRNGKPTEAKFTKALDCFQKATDCSQQAKTNCIATTKGCLKLLK